MTADTRHQGRSNRRRGRQYEQQVARYLRDRGLPVERTPLGRHDDHGDLDGLPGLLVECRNRREILLGPWLTEITRKSAGTGRSPLLLIKRRGTTDIGESYAVLRLADFVQLTGLGRDT